jgi:hypothetical protein
MSKSPKGLNVLEAFARGYDPSVPNPFRPCALVPAFQAEKTVGAVVRALAAIVPRVVVVDDGSLDRTTAPTVFSAWKAGTSAQGRKGFGTEGS